jgi:hypothetical protein
MELKNPRREKFAQAVARGRQQTSAYEEAGFVSRGKLACNSSMRLLKDPTVTARIEELRAEALTEYRLNRRKVLDYLVDVILTPAGHVVDGDPLCQSFRTSDKGRTMRMPDKIRAAEMLAKLCGWFPTEKPEAGPVEVIVTIGPDAK